MNRADRLRLSLLVSLGIPVACGGTVLKSHDDVDTGSGGSGASKAGRSTGGALARGGSGNQGGATTPGGATTFGGKATFGGMNGTAGAPEPPKRCTGSKLDPLTGLVSCNEGYRHRPAAVACGDSDGQGGEPPTAGAGPVLPRANGSVSCGMQGAGGESGGDGGGGAGSTSESPCAAFANGYCHGIEDGSGAGPSGVCKSGCSNDAECGAGFICICDEPDSPTRGACRPSNCKTDDACAKGYLCASYNGSCAEDGYACQQPTDGCSVDAECMGGACEWDSSAKRRVCIGCVPGRPFLVAAEPRFAPVAARSDWSLTGARPRVDHLTPQEREALAAHWTKLGQMEHASIAAFARFSLQLLSLGAPPELVEATTRALADETAHAKLCFAIASAYAGRAVGPGPLDVARSLEVTSLTDIVDLVIAEGCYGETSAVLEALEAADAASDPVIRAAYTQIAADEQRHAELAFRFVRWALERDRAGVSACIAAALSAPPRAAAARLVVAPCLQALVA